MSMFPGPGAQIYRNEEGEVLGWDYPSSEPEERDPYDDDRQAQWGDDEDEEPVQGHRSCPRCDFPFKQGSMPSIWMCPQCGVDLGDFPVPPDPAPDAHLDDNQEEEL